MGDKGGGGEMGEEMMGEEGRRAVVGEEGEGSEPEASVGRVACRLGQLGRERREGGGGKLRYRESPSIFSGAGSS